MLNVYTRCTREKRRLRNTYYDDKYDDNIILKDYKL